MSIDMNNIVFFAEQDPEYSEEETAEERCVYGRPLQRTWHHFTSADGKFFAGLWEAEPGCWEVAYSENEYCQILEGLSVLRDRSGVEHELKPGDHFVIPSGFEGQWEVLERTRKIYVIYEP
ncbi:MAG: cupin domain-containing protein [Lysobacterales bacterium]|jgi:uncharacterized cupin superfamily protein